MKPVGATTLFVFDEDAAVCGAAQGRATQRWTQLSGRFCNRLLIEGVRGGEIQKGIANHALK